MLPAPAHDSVAAPQCGGCPPRVVWLAVAAVFLLGVFMRVLALDMRPLAAEGVPHPVSRWHPEQAVPFLEIDERIYIALVEQLDAGRGYTLQGHPIIEMPWIIKEQYDHPLFYHPPGGVALFWLAHRLAGPPGLALVQVGCFAVFFWSVILLGWSVLTRSPVPGARGPSTDGSTTGGPALGHAGPLLGQTAVGVALCALAVAAAFTPIMAHVAGRLWLDGPLLAFSTAAAAIFLLGIRRRSTPVVLGSAALMGYASLIKLTAFLIVPGVAALAWQLTPRPLRGELLRRSALALAIAAAIQAPWELWQWAVVGSPFPGWAGKPAEALVRSNRYVHYVTIVRSPWIYVVLLPRVLWTLVPSLLLLVALRQKRELAARGTALVLWMAVVGGVHAALGASGYAKLLRLVILVTPPAAVLFALLVGGAVDQLRASSRVLRAAAWALLLLAAAGLGAEVAQSVRTSLHDNRSSDLIVPLTGLRE